MKTLDQSSKGIDLFCSELIPNYVSAWCNEFVFKGTTQLNRFRYCRRTGQRVDLGPIWAAFQRDMGRKVKGPYRSYYENQTHQVFTAKVKLGIFDRFLYFERKEITHIIAQYSYVTMQSPVFPKMTMFWF